MKVQMSLILFRFLLLGGQSLRIFQHCKSFLIIPQLFSHFSKKLAELVNTEGYYDWICLIAEFTMKSLRSWQWANTSVYYVLGLWSRLLINVGDNGAHRQVLRSRGHIAMYGVDEICCEIYLHV